MRRRSSVGRLRRGEGLGGRLDEGDGEGDGVRDRLGEVDDRGKEGLGGG